MAFTLELFVFIFVHLLLLLSQISVTSWYNLMFIYIISSRKLTIDRYNHYVLIFTKILTRWRKLIGQLKLDVSEVKFASLLRESSSSILNPNFQAPDESDLFRTSHWWWTNTWNDIPHFSLVLIRIICDQIFIKLTNHIQKNHLIQEPYSIRNGTWPDNVH